MQKKKIGQKKKEKENITKKLGGTLYRIEIS